MKVYKYDDGSNSSWFMILIEEDGIVKIATVGLSKTIVEHVGRITFHNSGSSRIVYNGGSSVPYKNADGTIIQRWKQII